MDTMAYDSNRVDGKFGEILYGRKADRHDVETGAAHPNVMDLTE
jgi:hypothetical protein